MVENVPWRQEIDFKKKNVSARKLQVKKGGLSNNDGNSSENITYPKSEFVVA